MFKKCVLILLAVLMLTACFSGCKSGGTTETPIDMEISDKTIEYTFFAHNLNTYADSDRILQEIEKKFNIKMKLVGAPANGWLEQLVLLINADDCPNAFNFIPNDVTYSVSYNNFVNKGMVLPLSDMMSEAETPNIWAMLHSDLYGDLQINGKNYFIPNPTEPTNHIMYYRKDWAKNLGISEPTTLDEFTEMLRAFTEDDPDGNGKNDTYGLAASKIIDWMYDFKATFGVQPGWSEDSSGVWQYDAFTDGYRDMLTWFNDIYSKGYMKSEFYLYEDSEVGDDFFNSKAGVTIANGGLQVSNTVAKMLSVNKDADVGVLAMPDGSGKGGYIGTGSWWAGWSIAYDAPEPFRLLKVLDYLYSEEGQKLRLYGIEGIHYSYDDDGKIVVNTEEREAEGKGKFPLSDDKVARSNYNFGLYFGSTFRIVDGKVQIYEDSHIYTLPELTEEAWSKTNKNIVYQYPATGIELPTEFSALSLKISDIVNTYTVRIIAGNIGFEDGMSRMKSEADNIGYAQVQEMMKEYAAGSKK